MLEPIYFVSWYIHNKTENVWNGTIVDQFNNRSAAEKEYHRQLSMYIDDPNYDSVAVMLTNSSGGVEMAGFWTPPTIE